MPMHPRPMTPTSGPLLPSVVVRMPYILPAGSASDGDHRVVGTGQEVPPGAGSLPEVVDDVGIVVPAASVEALSAAIVNLASDAALRHRLGSRSAARARDVFGLETMVSRTVALYEEIA